MCCSYRIIFGRIANFINGELYGKITTIYWGIIFPKIDGFTRHPSQLYEAILEGLVLFIILNKIIMKKNYVLGTCSYMFLILYGSFRIFAEIFREPDLQIGYLFNVLSMGTFLSILMIVIGIILFYFKKMKTNINNLSHKSFAVDEFFNNALFDKKRLLFHKDPFGKKGDFVTAPNISDIFSEIIGIWIVSTWEKLGKPKKINLIELGPGDGSMAKILIRTFKRFLNFIPL